MPSQKTKKRYTPPALAVFYTQSETGYVASIVAMSPEMFNYESELERDQGLQDYGWAEFTW